MSVDYRLRLLHTDRNPLDELVIQHLRALVRCAAEHLTRALR